MHMEHSANTTNLGEILERVLDKGLVIAGDIKVSIADIELLAIKIRLVLASVDKAREIGINWWEGDPNLSVQAARRKESLEKREREQLPEGT